VGEVTCTYTIQIAGDDLGQSWKCLNNLLRDSNTTPQRTQVLHPQRQMFSAPESISSLMAGVGVEVAGVRVGVGAGVE